VTTAKTLLELARSVGGEVLGDGDVEIRGVASIELAGPGEITFLAHPKYRSYLPLCRASGVILTTDSKPPDPVPPGQNYLCVPEPYVAFAKILEQFVPPPVYDGEVSPQATIHSSAKLAPNVTIFAQVYVGKEAEIGEGSVLQPGVFIGDHAIVGKHCMLHPRVSVGERCRVGDRVILHAGVVIGSDGFGYAEHGGERIKIPQVGIVEVGDDVEIGANSALDRATLGKTVIGAGTKIDNLVHIAHNVVVGEHSLIIAQAGIAGSTKIGKRVILAGQVGVLNHIEIGDGAIIGPQSGIAQSVPAGAVLSSGLAAVPHKQWLRVVMALPRLPELLSRVRALERKVARAVRSAKKGARSHARH
jgi:UDP-3-O-[3-hydroxymyristoyl] glucosamine N-acyltransferase